jgi:hypothetical protein
MAESFLNLLRWIQATPGSTGIRESTWTYPVIESVHVLGLCLFLGFALIWDMRLLNKAFRRVPVSDIQARVMPWVNVGFIIMVISGSLLFYEEPVRFYGNIFFRLKIVALLLAGLNALIFHFFTSGKRLVEWDSSPISPRSAKVAGYVSIFLWVCIVVFGRFIAYNWFDPLVPQS